MILPKHKNRIEPGDSEPHSDLVVTLFSVSSLIFMILFKNRIRTTFNRVVRRFASSYFKSIDLILLFHGFAYTAMEMQLSWYRLKILILGSTFTETAPILVRCKFLDPIFHWKLATDPWIQNLTSDKYGSWCLSLRTVWKYYLRLRFLV